MIDPAENQKNLVKYMTNPKAFTLRKWFYDLLQMNYSTHDAIIERVSTSLATDKDLEDFGKLIGQVFETGYRKALSDYAKQMEDLGLKVQFYTPETTN
jgi:hypothetical protein